VECVVKAKVAASKDEAEESSKLWNFMNLNTAKEFDPFGPITIFVDLTPATSETVVEDIICTKDMCPDGSSRNPKDCSCPALTATKEPFDPRDWQQLTKKPTLEETKRLAKKIYNGVDVNSDQCWLYWEVYAMTDSIAHYYNTVTGNPVPAPE